MAASGPRRGYPHQTIRLVDNSPGSDPSTGKTDTTVQRHSATAPQRPTHAVDQMGARPDHRWLSGSAGLVRLTAGWRRLGADGASAPDMLQGSTVKTSGELAIVIARGLAPPAARGTRTPRESTRERNGSLWFGAERQSGRRPGLVLHRRGRRRSDAGRDAGRQRLVGALIVWITPGQRPRAASLKTPPTLAYSGALRCLRRLARRPAARRIATRAGPRRGPLPCIPARIWSVPSPRTGGACSTRRRPQSRKAHVHVAVEAGAGQRLGAQGAVDEGAAAAGAVRVGRPVRRERSAVLDQLALDGMRRVVRRLEPAP